MATIKLGDSDGARRKQAQRVIYQQARALNGARLASLTATQQWTLLTALLVRAGWVNARGQVDIPVLDDLDGI